MSILIKGMEMPRDCEECRFSEVIDGLGCIVTHLVILRRYGQDKPKWCPLIEVPTPHGRLIDADKLPVVDFFDNENWYTIIHKESIDAAPTIIEAEEGEDE